MTLRSPTRWHGGKYYLAKKIAEIMPPHKRYLEAYSGGLSVLFAKPFEGVAEWVNDTDNELMSFWRVLATPVLFEQFRRLVEALPLSESLFNDSDMLETYIGAMEYGCSVRRAAAFFVRNRQSRQGLGRDYCTPTKRRRRGMNENVSAWLTAVDWLPEVHKRLRRVEIWSRDAVKAIAKLDCEDLLVYCDPPYLPETRSTTGEYGAHEMPRDSHAQLLAFLLTIKGKFILSGYPSEMYSTAEFVGNWNRIDVDIPNNASSSKTKERKTECLWTNFPVA